MSKYTELVKQAKTAKRSDEQRPLDRDAVQRLLDELPAADAPPPVIGGRKEIRRKPTRPQTSLERYATFAGRKAAHREQEAKRPANRLAGCYMSEVEDVVVDPRTKLPMRVTTHRTWYRRRGKHVVAFQQDGGPIIYEEDRAAPPVSVSASGSAGWGFFRGRRGR